MGIVPGKCYSCEWMVGGIYKADLNLDWSHQRQGKMKKSPLCSYSGSQEGPEGKQGDRNTYQLQMQGDRGPSGLKSARQ